MRAAASGHTQEDVVSCNSEDSQKSYVKTGHIGPMYFIISVTSGINHVSELCHFISSTMYCDNLR